MKNKTIRHSHNDIPFPEAQLTIHNPTIDEISLIGEDNFHPGIRLLAFSKQQLKVVDNSDLSNKSDFDILMAIMKSPENPSLKNSATMVLSLLFPDYEISYDLRKGICFKSETHVATINNNNFEIFKDIINEIFVLDEMSGASNEYNPADGVAKRIAEKLQKAKEKKAQLANKDKDLTKDLDLYGHMISILAVGEHKDKNQLMQYTVYQLKDEFQRFQLKEAYDIYVQAKMAGAKDLDEVENWMK